MFGFGLTLAMLAAATATHATSFKVLHSFTGGTDGCSPLGGALILDRQGNLYGTTAGSSCGSYGTVFRISPDGSEAVLYAFKGGGNGSMPFSLLKDESGNLFGMTFQGGNVGCGVIFEVPSSGNEKTVHEFAGPPDDGCIAGALITGNDRNIYGTTDVGGKHDGGTVFKLTKNGGVSLLYSFCRKAHCADGESPLAGLTPDTSGNFYGTTQSGGRLGCGNECGTVFELAPHRTETVLYKFKGPPNDGNDPQGGLILDQTGNFWGTLEVGGRTGCLPDEGCGAVFKLAPDGTEAILHFFTGAKGDGSNPVGNLIMDGEGNLYGTTQFGGGRGCTVITIGCGTVFEITTSGAEVVLHSFGSGSEGAIPAAGLVADTSGNLYGTASEGGARGFGTVFEITP